MYMFIIDHSNNFDINFSQHDILQQIEKIVLKYFIIMLWDLKKKRKREVEGPHK